MEGRIVIYAVEIEFTTEIGHLRKYFNKNRAMWRKTLIRLFHGMMRIEYEFRLI